MDEIDKFADEIIITKIDIWYSMTKQLMNHLWIVLLFAVLHGLCCICCRTLGIEDARALTMLTIAMAFVLSYLRGLRLYFIITAIIIINVLAYLVGSALPMVLKPLMGESLWIYVISTTATTLIMGIIFELTTDLVLIISGNEDTFKDRRQKKEFRQRWVVRMNDRIFPVKVDQIAYFFSEDKCNYLVTFDGGRYIVDSTMDSIFEELDPERFFKINRGCILGLESIDSAVVNGGRYTVQAHPSLGVKMVVARSRVDDFVKWLG